MAVTFDDLIPQQPVTYGPGSQYAGSVPPPAQVAYGQANAPFVASGGGAAPGTTPANPVYDTPTAQGGPDSYHVTQAGQLSSPGQALNFDDLVPPQRSNELLGFNRELARPLDNVSGWVDGGLQKLGVPMDAVNKTLGFPTQAQTHAAILAPVLAAAQKGIVPGKIGGALGGILGAAPAALLPGGPLLQGAVTGALSTDDPNSPLATTTSALTGLVGGGIAGGAAKFAGKVVAPKIGSALRVLSDAGVPFTPGQVLGNGGEGGFIGNGLQRVEDAASSVPLLGDLINGARTRSLQGFNKGAINMALKPIGKELPANLSSGTEAVAHASDLVDQAYDTVAKKSGVTVDPQFIQDATGISQQANTLGGSNPQRYADVIANEFGNRLSPGGVMSGDKFVDAKAGINAAISKYSGASDPDSVDLVQRLKDFKGAMLDNLARSSPDAASDLKAADTAFAHLATVQNAAGKLGSDGGMFTPAQLMNAVRSGDQSARKNVFAQGGALMQDYAQAGKDVLPSKVPDSGTALRYMISELPILLGVGAESHVLPLGAALPAMAGTGLLGGAYTRTGQKALGAILNNQATGARSVLNGLSRPASVTGGVTANSILQLLSGPPVNP